MSQKKPESRENEPAVELKDPVMAAVLAWLIPGLGHLYQRRKAKAALFFVCIMSTFMYGLYLGSDREEGLWGRAVYFQWQENEKRLAYLCQIGVGLPALPAMVQAARMNRNKRVWWGGFEAPPRPPDMEPENLNAKQPTENQLHKTLHRYFGLATAYTMIAGLLNVLAIYDAWGGPVLAENAGKEEEGPSEEKQDDSEEAA